MKICYSACYNKTYDKLLQCLYDNVTSRNPINWANILSRKGDPYYSLPNERKMLFNPKIALKGTQYLRGSKMTEE